MEIHLIRHTAVDNPENLCYGFAEMPLEKNISKILKA
jgi:alpha-ribazole phosphatase